MASAEPERSFSPMDVVPAAGGQVAAVGCGGEPAVGDPHDPGQGPVPHVVLDLADQRGVAGVAGPAPHPHRDPVPGDRHPDHDLRAGRRGSPWTCRRSGTRPCRAVALAGRPRRRRLPSSAVAVVVGEGGRPWSSRATGSSGSSVSK